VVIALPHYSTSHTLFRKFLNSLGARYASMPRLEEKMFYTALSIDFEELEKDTKALKERIGDASSVVITAGNGTEISMELSGRELHADTGNLREKGSFGNLPAGELYVAPLEDRTNGKFVVEYGLGKRLEPPLTLYVEKGTVKRMEGNEELKGYLTEIFNLNERNAVVAELGIGTNKKAEDVFNVLEAEKIYNTCHIALGDNSTFGGKNIATAHIDFVIFNPDLRWK
jgi:leucyl aminopeptidase (aminopeptidase T)